jgi:hypothetical protein
MPSSVSTRSVRWRGKEIEHPVSRIFIATPVKQGRSRFPCTRPIARLDWFDKPLQVAQLVHCLGFGKEYFHALFPPRSSALQAG